MRILVADDAVETSTLISDVLSAHGHTVDVVDNGTAAWERINSTDYDLILCDVVLPGIDGLILHRRLGEQRPDLLPRLLLMSGHGHEYLRRFTEIIDVPLLAKPFGVDDLLAYVERRAAGC